MQADVVLADAVERLTRLIDEARRQGAPEAEAAALATATRDGIPSVRTVGIVRVDAQGLVFFADEASGKGRQLAENPRAAVRIAELPEFTVRLVGHTRAGVMARSPAVLPPGAGSGRWRLSGAGSRRW